MANKCVCGCGSAPDPAGGAYSVPPDPLAGLRGHTSKGMGSEGGGKGEGWRGNASPLQGGGIKGRDSTNDLPLVSDKK